MVNKSVIRRRITESRGFSLLEIIFVLAFLGVILVTAGNYARKLIDEKTRQTAADAVAQDVFGVLQFVNTETLETYRSYDPNDVNKRAMKKVTNPLYQLPGMAVYPEAASPAEAALKGLTSNPVWLAHPHDVSSLDATIGGVSPYIARNYSTSITDPINNSISVIDGGKTRYSHSLKWSQSQWLTESVRSYFTDSGCQNGVTGTNVIYFSQQFLSCNENPALRNSEIGISRIDLVNDKGSFTRISTSADLPAPVNRVDIYVSFWPADRNSARIEQYITPLMTAFRTQKIMPNTDNIFLVMKQPPVAGNDNAWTLLNKNNGNPAVKSTPVTDLARYSDLPDLVGKLHEGQTYAIRFSFDGKGDYLRTDGLNSAEKVCWNTITGTAGPCLTSPSQDALVLKQRQNINDFANLQVGEVVSRGNHLQADGTTITDEYYTSPQIRYAAFNNTGQIPPYFRNPADGATDLCTADTACGLQGPTPDEIADTANGAIAVPLQTCPRSVVNGNGTHVDMYPRLSAAVSSVVSGIRKNADGTIFPNNTGHYFDSQVGNLVQLNRSDISINRLGGAVLQISQSGATWRIAAMVGSEDTGIKSHPWQYYNPPWLSVMITTWCSSVDQP